MNRQPHPTGRGFSGFLDGMNLTNTVSMVMGLAGLGAIATGRPRTGALLVGLSGGLLAAGTIGWSRPPDYNLRRNLGIFSGLAVGAALFARHKVKGSPTPWLLAGIAAPSAFFAVMPVN